MLDLVDKKFKNKYGREFEVVSYEGKFKKNETSKAYTHYYIIRFVLTKNEYPASRQQIKALTCKDLKQIEIENKIKKKKEQEARARKNKYNTIQYKKFDFNDKYVLGIDASTTSTGWCCVKNGEIKKFGSITFKDNLTKEEIEKFSHIPEIKLLEKEYDWRRRAYLMLKELKHYIKYADIIIIEDANGGKNIKIGLQLSELRGYILSAAHIFCKEFEVYPPSKWRKHYGFTGKRKELKKQAVDKFQEITGKKDIDLDDIAEAVLIALSAEYISKK